MCNENDKSFVMFMVVVEVINIYLDWKFCNEVMKIFEFLSDNIK